MIKQIELVKQKKKLTEPYQQSNCIDSAKNQSPSDDKKNYEKYFFVDADDAAYECNLQQLEKLITEKNVNTVNHDGNPIIFSAIKKAIDNPNAPVEPILEFLINKGACINSLLPEQRMSTFEYATRLSLQNLSKNLKVLEYFLKKGVNPFLAPPTKQSGFEIALQCAMNSGKELCPQAYWILKLFRNKTETLHQAILSFNVKKVAELANEESVQEIYDGQKPLYTAITHFTKFNHKQMLPIVEILLQKKIDPNEKIEHVAKPFFEEKLYLNTYLMIATIISIFQKNAQMIPVLLNAGADPHKSFGPNLPSAFMLADKAAHLSLQDIENQKCQGFSIEISQIVKNKEIASEISALFSKHQQKK